MKRKLKLSLLSFITILFVLVQMIFFTGVSHSEYPDRPVTLLVVFDPGSTTDLIGRTVAVGAEKALGTRIVIENRGGGGGTVGMVVLANAKPDGYTIAAGPTDVIVHGPLMLKVPYKPLKSFTPIIGMTAAANTGLIVNKDAPWKTFQEFIDYAKKNPGKIKYSTMGVGSALHAAMEYIGKKDGIKWTHIPYKSATQARTSMMGGHVDACSAGAEFVPFAREGEVRVLATHGEKRSPQFPNVPTLKELGYDFTKETIHSIFGPANLPPEILHKLEMAFTKGTETPEFKTLIEKIDCTPAYYSSKDLDTFLKGLWGRTEKMFKDAGIIKETATQPY
jgi:tripartite-type tricarboxylate transporter receptor subunit TctC